LPRNVRPLPLNSLEIIMANKHLEIIHSQKESQKVKSGCFDENVAFIYSTSAHIKYIFCEGRTTGMFKSIEEPVYIAFVRADLSD